MDYSKPTLLVISGPNGAGKSTYINSMLPDEFGNLESFDRDKTRSEFEQQLRLEGLDPDQMLAKATQLMEERLVEIMEEAIRTNAHFVLETPLSHPDYWAYIDRFEKNGYQIQLSYLCLERIRDCELRVQQRVLEGGHYVDARTIKGVYETNLKYINDYSETFKVICLYDGMKVPDLLVRIEDNNIVSAKGEALKKAWIKNGLPKLATKILPFWEAQKKA